MQLETINRLFLELSQIATVETAKELRLRKDVEGLTGVIKALVDSPVVSGMCARIRDEAESRGVPDPWHRAKMSVGESIHDKDCNFLRDIQDGFDHQRPCSCWVENPDA